MSYPVFTECHETGVGEAANDLWLHTRIAALNLRRLVNLGLHRPRAAWALATPAGLTQRPRHTILNHVGG